MPVLRMLSFVCLCLALAGCGSKHGDRPAVHPVNGKLLVGGEPAVNAEVVLYPVGREQPLMRPHATVQSDGSFRLTTFATRDGAPVGDFALTVTWPGPRAKGQAEDEAGPDRLRLRYTDPKKPAASVRIEAETAQLATLDLKPVEAKTAPLAASTAGMDP